MDSLDVERSESATTLRGPTSAGSLSVLLLDLDVEMTSSQPYSEVQHSQALRFVC